MLVEIGILPGYVDPRYRRKKRRCKYPAGSKRKAKWRALLRKYRRRRKRKRKAKTLKTKSSTTSKTSKSSVSPAEKAEKDKRNELKKRKKIRKKKVRQRKHRLRRHLPGSKERKLQLIGNIMKGMTTEMIEGRLNYLRRKRKEILFKFHKARAMTCAPKRKAIRHFKKCFKKARHKKKKYRRYRRKLQKLAKRKGLTVWRKCQIPKKPKVSKSGAKVNSVTPVKPKKPSKRVEYQRQFPIKPTLNAIEMKSTEKHIKQKDRVDVDNLYIATNEDVIGNYGQVTCQVRYTQPEQNVKATFRWQCSISFDKCGSKEAQILARLAQINSRNSMRLLFHGQYLNLQYWITTVNRKELSSVIKEKMDISAYVHIIQQTFYCVKDLHKVGYCHLNISPSSFSYSSSDSLSFVFNNFEFANTRESLKKKPEMQNDKLRRLKKEFRRERLPKNPVNPYMSRRQHFRMATGTADDYESWFYVCARILNEEPLEWEKDNDMEHTTMALAKYNFIKKLSYRDPLTDLKMKHINQYCMAATNKNVYQTAYFIERIIQDWVDRKPMKLPAPWQREADIGAKADYEEWLKNNPWMKPRPERKIEF
ncbi:hypothetical protein GCK72_019254 [Caenorhabditis remanei]|uniref:Protein kinase domain-containing protein n=1 Tax=Caenorhabditis remanei TaxID=31234 RepID=A0A6A5GE40_CAERE|nr:hypothetical protein GCK72_019254 [Caenorhabditis remanei]KAF1752699.1 hypothetical protein GCK72_019254 [Caenorhabditis remanei]